ncbi:MAG TPA: uroporphyrinogen-III synthase [Nitrososphaera sp.]|jgi:uroporphyrinogen-III synthase|nr:uroporphyrinogen-III synthase [Nitrososphaeraceae archaeon]
MPKLKNKILAITRSEQDAKEFLQLVREQGGWAIALPVIEIVPRGPEVVEEFLDKLCKKKHYYCAFMSQQAVNILFDVAHDKIAPLLKSTTVIAVGPKTKQSLEERGIKVGLILEKFSSFGLVDLMSEVGPCGKKIIIPRSAAASDLATKALIRLGMDVDEILLYTVRTRAIEPIWKEFCELLSKKRVDVIIFTSTSNVNSFFEIMEKLSKDRLQLDNVTKVVSIGPFTTKALRDRGIRCFEAKEHTVRGALQIAEQIL